MLQTMTCGRKGPVRPVIRQLGGPDGVELLGKLFLQETTGVTIIAIDFEYHRWKKGNISIKEIKEIGISTFSIDEWLRFTCTQKSKIYSRCHLMPKISPGRFLFGESERMLRRNIPQFLKDIISMKSPAGTPSKVALVGHQVSAELDIMQEIGIDLRTNFTQSRVYSTFPLSLENLDYHSPVFLPQEGSRSFWGIPFQKCRLHNARNDAHFTLRALLKLAATSLQRMKLDASPTARIFDLESIARSPIDFGSRTPDTKKFHTDIDIEKALKREQAMKSVDDDWWDDSLGGLLGMTLVGMDADI